TLATRPQRKGQGAAPHPRSPEGSPGTRAELQASARSTSQRGALRASEASRTINRDKLKYRVLLRKPLEHVREIRLQRTDESIGDADPIPYQATSVFHQLGQGAHLGTLGHEGLELLTVPK